MAKYETAVVFDSDWNESEKNSFLSRLEEIVGNFSGTIFDREDWGSRKLAYTIQKKDRGHYIFLRYDGENGVIAELERVLRLNENVLRFLSTRFERDIKGKYPKPPPIEEILERDVIELQRLRSQWRRGTSPAAEEEKKVEEESKAKPEEGGKKTIIEKEPVSSEPEESVENAPASETPVVEEEPENPVESGETGKDE